MGAPMSEQNLERMGVPYISAFGYTVVFDCKPLLGRTELERYAEPAEWEHVVSITSVRAFEQALRCYQPIYALDFIGLGEWTPLLQSLLAASGAQYVVQKTGSLPAPSLWSRVVWKLRVHLRQLVNYRPSSPLLASAPSRRRLYDWIGKFWSIYKLRCSLRPPDLALLAGKASVNHFTSRARKILWVGSQDYHVYQRASAQPYQELVRHPYTLFIDDNLPFASDWKLLGITPPVTPKIYYESMRNFFDLVESAWGMPIVIAGHPSGRHDQRIHEGFGRRTIIYNQTAQLTIHATVILAHGSTAVSFAILGQKPLVFLSTKELNSAQYGLHIRTMANRLGKKIFNIDRDFRVPPLNCISADIRRYQAYVNDFICSSEVAEDLPWDTFLDHIIDQSGMIQP
jgi:hypothetical protein